MGEAFDRDRDRKRKGHSKRGQGAESEEGSKGTDAEDRNFRTCLTKRFRELWCL